MAIRKVIGVVESKGNFNGTDYRNLVLHTTYTDQYVIGEKVEQYKAKWSNLDEVFALGLSDSEIENLDASSFSDLVGKTVKLYADRFKVLDRVFVPEESKSK